MSETDPAPVVRLARVLPAAPARVFAAWLDPSSMARWLSPVGQAVAEVDARVGGRLRVTMVGDGTRIEHTGTYVEIDSPRRLAFTWQSPYTGGRPSLVTIEFVAVDGGTELRLMHERLPAEDVEAHGNGWGRILGRLGEELATQTNGGS